MPSRRLRRYSGDATGLAQLEQHSPGAREITHRPARKISRRAVVHDGLQLARRLAPPTLRDVEPRELEAATRLVRIESERVDEVGLRPRAIATHERREPGRQAAGEDESFDAR